MKIPLTLAILSLFLGATVLFAPCFPDDFPRTELAAAWAALSLGCFWRAWQALKMGRMVRADIAKRHAIYATDKWPEDETASHHFSTLPGESIVCDRRVSPFTLVEPPK